MDDAALAERWSPPVPVAAAEVSRVTAGAGVIFVVLDDDPTGTQSVQGIPVLTDWQPDDLAWAIAQHPAAFYVLTNSRSLAPAAAAERNREVVRNALAAAQETGTELAFVSRSDSTLRGHFPLETDVITATLVESGQPAPDGVIIVPAFPDAGRVTIDSVHYCRTGGVYTPVAETEFARDATFGFDSSRLDAWVAEKTGGSARADSVVRLTLDLVRSGPAAIADVLRGVTDGRYVVVDAVVEDDLRLVALALARVEAEGRSFLYRVGPPFVRARIGQPPAEPLSAAGLGDLAHPAAGGLVVVGSHVDLTTRQLAGLRAARPELAVVEVAVLSVVDPIQRATHLDDVVARVSDLVRGGADVIVQTSRALVTGVDAETSLELARQVSAAVVEVVARTVAVSPPRFVVAKGGITSSDVASRGLGIRHALVRGPMLPGLVSLWEPMDGPAVGIPYVIFAGNVGDESSLVAVMDKLSPPDAR